MVVATSWLSRSIGVSQSSVLRGRLSGRTTTVVFIDRVVDSRVTSHASDPRATRWSSSYENGARTSRSLSLSRTRVAFDI